MQVELPVAQLRGRPQRGLLRAPAHDPATGRPYRARLQPGLRRPGDGRDPRPARFGQRLALAREPDALPAQAALHAACARHVGDRPRRLLDHGHGGAGVADRQLRRACTSRRRGASASRCRTAAHRVGGSAGSRPGRCAGASAATSSTSTCTARAAFGSWALVIVIAFTSFSLNLYQRDLPPAAVAGLADHARPLGRTHARAAGHGGHAARGFQGGGADRTRGGGAPRLDHAAGRRLLQRPRRLLQHLLLGPRDARHERRHGAVQPLRRRPGRPHHRVEPALARHRGRRVRAAAAAAALGPHPRACPGAS